MPDVSEFAPLVSALVPDGYLEARLISTGSGPARQEFLDASDRTKLATALCRLIANQDDTNVFFGVLPRSRKSGKATDCPTGHAVWVDIDRSDAAELLADFPAVPSFTVESGSEGHLHAYWLLDEPATADHIVRMNKRLAMRLRGDKNCCDAARIMRLPGSWNPKAEARCRILEASGERTSLSALDQALGGAETPSTRNESASMMSPTQRVLALLGTTRPTGDGWKAVCPAHDDQDPSLSIAEGEDGRCLLKCFAGCSTAKIVSALGLELSDLFARRAKDKGTRQLDVLLDYVARSGAELFHSPDHRPYVLTSQDGRRECIDLGSPRAAHWIQRTALAESGQAARADVVSGALDQMRAEALYEGTQRDVYRRVAGDLDRLVIDLGDETRRAIEVTSSGWRLVTDPGILFIREAGAGALPVPSDTGDLRVLRDLLSLESAHDWALLRGALLGAFHPTGPYLVTFFTGPAGSGKSVAARYVASLIDPMLPQAITGTPHSRDLLLAASKGHLTVLDNVSSLSRALSDTLAVIATGAGDRRRALYTDDQPFAVEAKGPTLITSLTQVARQPDLISRAAFVHFRAMNGAQVRPERDVRRDLESARPGIFGGLLDALTRALRHADDVPTHDLPRMADIAKFVAASEIGGDGDDVPFGAALATGQRSARDGASDEVPFVAAVIDFMTHRDRWEGSATELLAEMSRLARALTHSVSWPSNASTASQELDEHAATLRDHGISFERRRIGGGNRSRRIVLTRDEGRDGTAPDARLAL